MKAVIYHAEAPKLWDAPEGLYKRLFKGFKDSAKRFGIETIHLTLKGMDGWGDENVFFDGLDPVNVVYNREFCFHKFMQAAPDDVYLFTEPDARIVAEIPSLKADIALLFRSPEGPHFTPSWRMARKSALPIFEETLANMAGQRMDWHGDSNAFAKLYEGMGSPQKFGITIDYKGLKVELRDYYDYTMKHSRIMTHHKFKSKVRLK